MLHYISIKACYSLCCIYNLYYILCNCCDPPFIQTYAITISSLFTSESFLQNNLISNIPYSPWQTTFLSMVGDKVRPFSHKH